MAKQLLENDVVAEARMRDLAESLSEKDRRRFSAFEATQRGYGGIAYVAGVLGCSTRTIERGIKELDHWKDDPAAGPSASPRCGSKKKIASKSSEEENLISCLEVRTAGDPDDEDIVFTDLSPRILSGHLEAMGTPVERWARQ